MSACSVPYRPSDWRTRMETGTVPRADDGLPLDECADLDPRVPRDAPSGGHGSVALLGPPCRPNSPRRRPWNIRRRRIRDETSGIDVSVEPPAMPPRMSCADACAAATANRAQNQRHIRSSCTTSRPRLDRRRSVRRRRFQFRRSKLTHGSVVFCVDPKIPQQHYRAIDSDHPQRRTCGDIQLNFFAVARAVLTTSPWISAVTSPCSQRRSPRTCPPSKSTPGLAATAAPGARRRGAFDHRALRDESRKHRTHTARSTHCAGRRSASANHARANVPGTPLYELNAASGSPWPSVMRKSNASADSCTRSAWTATR